jgi:hypothetical protein
MSSYRRFSRLAVLGCAAMLLSSAVQLRADNIITYDIQNDFSGTNNPNGQWSYGYKAMIGDLPSGVFSLALNLGTNPQHAEWYDVEPGWSGADIWKNYGSPAYGIGTGEVSVDSDGNETSTIRWTAPVGGTVSVVGGYGLGDFGVGHRSVFLDSTQLWEVTSQPGNFSFTNLTVNAGDTIDFTAWDAGQGGGNTPISATITLTTPEPSTLALLISALLGLGTFLFVRQRRVAKG